MVLGDLPPNTPGEIIKPVDLGGPPVFKFKNTLLRFQKTSENDYEQRHPSFNPHIAVAQQPLSDAQQHTLDIALRESGVAPAHVIMHHASPTNVPPSSHAASSHNLRSRSFSPAPAPPTQSITVEQQLQQREALLSALSQRAAVGAPQILSLTAPEPEGVLLETAVIVNAATCQTVAIDKCFGGTPYSGSLNLPGLSSLQEAKDGMKKLFELLPMAFSLGGDASGKITSQMPHIATVLCSAVVPPCSASCVPLKACNSGCLHLQQTVLNDDVRGQLSMVGPSGPLRGVITSMVTGPALVVLDSALEILEDPTCLASGTFDEDTSTCLDAQKYTPSVCAGAGAGAGASASAGANASASVVVEPEQAAPSAAATGTSGNNGDGSSKSSVPLSGTQIAMANVVETAADEAKDDIDSLIPEIEREISKQGQDLEGKLVEAERGLLVGVNSSVANNRTMEILKHNTKDLKSFTMNETHKLKLLDAAYTACEPYTQHPIIAPLFRAVEMSTTPRSKHDLLIRLREECKELDHPTPPNVEIHIQESEQVLEQEMKQNMTNTSVSNATESVLAVEDPALLPVVVKTTEERVEDLERSLVQKTTIETPYDKKDDMMIQDLLNQYPRGNREQYTREQYKWMKTARAGSAAVRQFAQWQPRYTHDQVENMIANGTWIGSDNAKKK